ncbi:MAG: diguanylate cyclase [Candidatus Omnitrophica bacterium]|nr:diguanylate cyclase [Candidatus Omnitrophota bacterium]
MKSSDDPQKDQADEARRGGLAARLKSGFISTISHEIMTPLSVIKEAVSLLLEGLGGKLTEKQSHFLKMARQNVERACNVVYELRGMSREELEQPTLRRTELDLRELVQGVVGGRRGEFGRRGLKVSVRVPRKLVYVLCDGLRMHKALGYLVDECIGTSRRGSRVSLNVTIDGENARVIIYWTRKAASTRDNALPGSGLGFKIARTLIEVHGGRLVVEAMKGGYGFKATLPLFNVDKVPPDLVREMIDKADATRDACSLLVVTVDRYEDLAVRNGVTKARKAVLGMGALLRRQLRPATDTVVRCGRASYMVLLDSTYPSGRRSVKHRLDRLLRRYQFQLLQGLGPVSIRSGAASYPEDASGPLTLMQKSWDQIEPVSPLTDQILIAGEGAETHRSLAQKVRECGYQAVSATGEADIWSRILKERPWLIFLDIGPDELGLERVKKIKEVCPDGVVIVAGASTFSRQIVAAIKAGAFDYAEAPFSEALIRAQIQAAREAYIGEFVVEGNRSGEGSTSLAA